MGSFRRLRRSDEPDIVDPGEDKQYLAWVRRQPCAHCGHIAPSEAHHSTVHSHECSECLGPELQFLRRGKGQKAHDHCTFPLCHRCHREFHDASGDFRDWDKPRRRQWQERLVREYHVLNRLECF